MTRLLAGAVAVLVLAAGSAQAGGKDVKVVPPRKGKTEILHLFDGKTLDGWYGHEHLFSVQDGAIVAANSKPIKVSTYLYTKRKFTDFRLTLDAKLVKSKMHSGVCFWGRIAPEKGDKYTYQGHLVMFPSPWGMYDLYRRAGKLGVSNKLGHKFGKETDWNKIEILAQGNRVRVAVNGHETFDWRDPHPEYIQESPIGLQLHSNSVPQEVHFKGLILETFPKEDRLLTVK